MAEEVQVIVNDTQEEVSIYVGTPSAGVLSVVAGTNVTVDNTDPQNPIVSSTGGGGSVQIIHDANFTLDPTENDATIISEGKICTIDPITKTYPSAFTVAMKNDAAATNLVIVPKTGWSYQLNDADAVSLTTGGSNVTLTWTKGGTCTVILKGSTNKIMIDGGIE